VSRSPELRRARVVVRGHVQAVGFRANAWSRARSLGLAGWVRNNPDGSVEAELEGPARRVEPLVEWFRRGPRGARVDGIRVEWLDPVGEHGFAVR
jgi:acylphosphatase